MHFSHTPDVLVFNGVMELLVCPFPLGLLEGMVEVEVGLVLLGVGGGEACCHVGEVALVIPPGQASWVRVAFSIKGELAGFFHMVVEGVKERLEGALSGCRQLLQGIIIQMLRLNLLQVEYTPQLPGHGEHVGGLL